jgi:hypothetical protein
MRGFDWIIFRAGKRPKELKEIFDHNTKAIIENFRDGSLRNQVPVQECPLVYLHLISCDEIKLEKHPKLVLFIVKLYFKFS